MCNNIHIFNFHTGRSILFFVFLYSTIIFNIFTPDISFAQEVRKKSNKVELKNKIIKQEENYLEGIKFYHLEKYEKAVIFFKKAMISDNKDHEIHYLMSKCFFRIKKYEKAIKSVKKAISTDKKQVYYYVLLANIYEALNDFQGISHTLLQLIKNCDVDKRVYWLKLANVYEANSDYGAALKCIDNLIKKTSNIWAFKIKKINLLDKSNRVNKGDELLEEYLNKNPYHFEALLFKAKRQLNHDNVKGAELTVKKAYKISRHNADLLKLASAIDRKKGNKQWKEGENLPLPVKLDRLGQMIKYKKYSMAKQQLETLRIKHPTNIDVLFLLGKVSYLTGNQIESIAYFEQVVKDDIGNLDALEYLWKAYIETKAGDKLIKSTIDTLELYPNQSKVYLYCGEGYWLNKESTKAIEYWEKGIKLAIKTPIGDEITKKLKMAKEKK